MTIFGWDASDFDADRGPVDLFAAARDQIRFFTHKAWEGSSIAHTNYGPKMAQARDAGIPFLGPYFVVRTPGNNGHGSVANQVSRFLDYVRQQTPWIFDHPGSFAQVDTEHWGYDDVDPRYGAEACDLIQAQTPWVAIHYAPRWAYGDTIPGNHPLWASSYGTNPAVPYRDAYPGDGSGAWAPYSGRVPKILQYGSRLIVGSQGTCDGNGFRGTEADFARMIGREAKKVTTPLRQDGDFDWMMNRLEGMAHMRDTIAGGLGKGDPIELVKAIKRIDTNAATAAATAAPVIQADQAMFDAAVLKAMQDPGVLKGIGDAIAAHLHVT